MSGVGWQAVEVDVVSAGQIVKLVGKMRVVPIENNQDSFILA